MAFVRDGFDPGAYAQGAYVRFPQELGVLGPRVPLDHRLRIRDFFV